MTNNNQLNQQIDKYKRQARTGIPGLQQLCNNRGTPTFKTTSMQASKLRPTSGGACAPQALSVFSECALNDALMLMHSNWCSFTDADAGNEWQLMFSCQLSWKYCLLLSTFAKFWNLCCFCQLTMRIEKWIKYHISKTNSALVAVWNRKRDKNVSNWSQFKSKNDNRFEIILSLTILKQKIQRTKDSRLNVSFFR